MASGQVIVKYDLRAVEEASGRAFDRAAAQVAKEIEAYIQTKSSRPYPPASKPGQYPRVRTGEFVGTVNVTGSRRGIFVRSPVPHGRFLEEGTVNMDPRPWATKALNARDWMSRIAKLARQYTGGSRKPSGR